MIKNPTIKQGPAGQLALYCDRGMVCTFEAGYQPVREADADYVLAALQAYTPPPTLAERRRIKPDDFTRVDNDVNGNPRYVLHFVNLATNAEHDSPDPINYPAMIARAHKAGGRKFHNKQYGGGIVFQSYSLDELCTHLNELREGK